MTQAELVSKVAPEKTGNPLALAIEERISREGPIPFRDFMDVWLNGITTSEGLFLPGYYTGTSVKIGNEDGSASSTSADFYTSPEASPVFGFLLSKQILEMRQRMGYPPNFKIVEMGAGNGTLAHDILHGIQHFDSEAFKDLEYVIVENSPSLIKRQKQRLAQYNFPVRFVHASVAEMPLVKIDGVFISNELPDDFPAHLVRGGEKGFEELYIKNGDGQFEEVWGEASNFVQDYMARYNVQLQEREVYACNIEANKWVTTMAQALNHGYVITIDYRRNPAGTPIQLYSSEEKDFDAESGFLGKKNLGKVNITSGIDFRVLASHGQREGLRNEGFVTQGGFLFGLGLHAETKKILVDLRGQLGDRMVNEFLAKALLDWGHYVLVQSKGVENSSGLSGLQYPYHDRDTNTVNLSLE